MKKLLIMAVAGLVACGAWAQNGYFKANSDGTIDVVATEAEVTKVTASGAVTVGGDLTSTGDLLLNGGSQSVTNGATLTATTPVVSLLGIGGANDTTNTITFAGTANGFYVIALKASTTNLVKIADTGTVYLAGDWIGDAGDTITLWYTSAGTYEVSRSNN